MPPLRHIRKRIASVKNTQQITKAMKMVAAAKLRVAEEKLKASRPYSNKLDELIIDLYERTELEGYPLLHGKEEIKTVELVVVTSDRGLCGAFNSNILRHAIGTIRYFQEQGKNVQLSVIGRKCLDFFKRRPFSIRKTYINFLRDVSYELALEVGNELVDAFSNNITDEVYLIYNEFISAIRQKIVTRKLIPAQLPEHPQPTGLEAKVDYRYEPNREQIFKFLLPKEVNFQLYRAFIESFTAEMGARMSSMDSASNNASEMIATLTLQYNRARQNAITTELMDIINGAEAQK